MIEQRTPEWFAQRLGKVTASRINDVMATLKSGGETASRKNYRAQLAIERLTQTQAQSFASAAMQWGTDCEPLAVAAYEAKLGVFVDAAAFVDHPHTKNSGASPDGLVGANGLLEVKCPNSATHFEWLLAGVVPKEHQNQMLWQMACTGRDWCDFVSYDPRMPEHAQLFVVRLERDDAAISKITKAVESILEEVDEMCAQIEAMRDEPNEIK